MKEKETAEGLCDSVVCVHVRERKTVRKRNRDKVEGKVKVTFINVLTLCTLH